MAKRPQVSTKRLLIGKANSTMVIAVGVAAFVMMSSLVVSRSLLAKRSYQSKIITAQETARDQLKKNIEESKDLVSSYREFEGRSNNIIGGSSTGTGERDGDNAKLTLDSLPSKYDFPAMASSLEKILIDRRYAIVSITGQDDEVTQNGGQAADHADAGAVDASGNHAETGHGVEPIEMPFELSLDASYDSSLSLLTVLQHSIRPIHLQKVNLTASGGQGGVGVSMGLTGKSYYQPQKTLSITYEVVP
jgi:hypothetical protein